MQEKISIIVPVYNVEKYLHRCVESVLNQSYKNLEIILIDDGSTDESGKICDEFKKNDNRIKVVHKENGGISDARNAGLNEATGEYIAFVDSDDWISPVMIERLYHTLKEYKTKLVVCEPIYVYETYVSETQFSGRSFELDKSHALEMLLADRKFRSVLWNKLYARALWNDVRFPENRHYEDVHVMYKIYDRCENVAYIDQGLYYYFQRRSSIVHLSQLESHLDLVHATIERAQYLEEKYPYMRLRLYASIITSILTVYREAGIYKMRLSDNIEKNLKKQISKYKAKGIFQYLSPRLKMEYILYGISPKLLRKTAGFTEYGFNCVRKKLR